MANSEIKKPRQQRNQGVTINVNPGTTARNSKLPESEPKTQQQENTEIATQEGSPPPIQKPPIFKQARIFTGGDGRTYRADPLAATVFARFNPQNYNVQPAEVVTYQDANYKRHGRI